MSAVDPQLPEPRSSRVRPRGQGAGWSTRLRIRVSRRHLDRRIAHGASPAENPLQELRAQQLSARSEREAIAACLENIIDAATGANSTPRRTLLSITDQCSKFSTTSLT
jgi:hypothetical protein